MKSFRDSDNVSWTVFEVRRQVASRGDAPVPAAGFSEGWLCFESAGAKRRLVKYPQRWRELQDAGLEQLLRAAQPAPRTALPTADDVAGGPPTREL